MGTQAKLRRVGGSILVAIPPALLEQLDLASDAPVALSVEGRKLIVEPAERPRYSLSGLLAETRKSRRRRSKDVPWVSGPRAGRELI